MSTDSQHQTQETKPQESKLNFVSWNHIKNYPIVSESISRASSLPFAPKVKSYVEPYTVAAVSYVTSVSLLVNVINTGDKFFDAGLNKIDERYPSIKTVNYEVANQFATEKYNTTVENVNKKINDSLKDEKSTASTIKKRLEPVLKIVNDVFEKALNFFFPVSKPAAPGVEGEVTTPATAQSADQLGRLVNLTKDATKRAAPLVSTVSTLPAHYKGIYDEEKTKGSTPSVALANTSRKLSQDAYVTLKPTLDLVNKEVHERLEKIGKTSTTEKPTEETVEPVKAVSTGVEVNATN
ncbi:unnamed protein product [Ambrosiozyma monospora]|uniref:Unnamed protein product n=1 Tax=Ambrosiozyma monospora TaxID=43982 RepID=A0ACB5T396_AMBMO|nr:unnamed protein product [Ambrosiozyma monospora]